MPIDCGRGLGTRDREIRSMDQSLQPEAVLSVWAGRSSARGRALLVALVTGGVAGLLVACSHGPVPLTPGERAKILETDHAALQLQQERVGRPITFFDAIARAMKYNLEHRVALLEKAVAQRQLELSKFSLLPDVTANTTFKARSIIEAGTGYPVTADGQPVPQEPGAKVYSVAQDRNKTTANLTAVWNVVDFGVSALDSQQEADRVLIAKENQRKAVHDLLQRVRATFWQAAGAQKLDDAIGSVLQQAHAALADARQVERERLKPPLEILRFQKTLMEIVRQFQDLRHQLSMAKTEFAALINLPPGTDFRLDIDDDPALAIPFLNITVEEMEQLALDNRPELRKKMYEARISSSDVRKAMLRLVPGLNFQVSHNWDNNTFSLYPQWEEAGATVVWNIWEILRGPARLRTATNKEELASMSRLAKHMAILTEVHIAFRRYLNDQRKLQAAEELDAIEQRIAQNMRATSRNNAQSQLEYITSTASAIMSRLQLYQAYADAQNAVGLIFATLGVDLAPKDVHSDDIPVLAEALREAILEWNEGVGNGPLQKLLGNLNAQPMMSAAEGMVSPPEPLLDGGTAISKDGQKGRGIPHYFLETQFLPELTAAQATVEAEQEPQKINQTGGEQVRQTDEAERHKDQKELQDKKEPAPSVVPVVPTSAGKAAAVKEAAVVKNAAVVDTGSGADLADEVQPAIPASAPLWRSGEEGIEPVEPKLFAEIQGTVSSWAEAWSRREPEAYFAFYDDPHFVPSYQLSLSEWRQRMANTLRALTFLHIEISELEVVRMVPPPVAGHTTARKPQKWLQVAVRESYRSDHLYNVSRKLLLLGKAAAGWKIYREASTELLQAQDKPPGFAVQVALVDQPAAMEKVRDEWLKKGFKPMVVDTFDRQKQLHYAIRIAYFREEARAIFLKWSLQLVDGVESMVVPAGATEMGVRMATDGVPAKDGPQEGPSPAVEAAPPAKKSVAGGVKPPKKSSSAQEQDDAPDENASSTSGTTGNENDAPDAER